MKIHVCMVSAQLLANYLPVKLDKPDAVLLINSQFTLLKGYTAQFEKMLLALGIRIYHASQLAPADDYVQLQTFFLEVSHDLDQLGATDITLNLTGGTKLMALACNEMLRTSEMRVIYTNTGSDKVDIISHESDYIVLPSLLTIEEYLTAYGVAPKSYNNMDADWVKLVMERAHLTKTFATYFPEDKAFLSSLNYCVQKALEKKPNSTQNKFRNPKQAIDRLNNNRVTILKKCVRYGLIDFDGHNIYFKSVAAAEYLGGFWLEEYAYLMCVEVCVDEVRCGQAIQWDKDTRNELDIVVIHNNRLLIMECKTRRYDRDKRKDNDSIYKLDSIAEDLRGLYGAKWLLSVDNVNKNIKKRAASQDINLISGNELKSLKTRILEWVNGKTI